MKTKKTFLSLAVLAIGLLFSTNNKAQTFVNTGKIFVAENNRPATMYINGDYKQTEDHSSIVQEGTTVITNDFVNASNAEKTFSEASNGTIVFRSEQQQHIKASDNIAGSNINFPNVRIDNPEGVMVSANTNVKFENIDLVRGQLIRANRTQNID